LIILQKFRVLIILRVNWCFNNLSLFPYIIKVDASEVLSQLSPLFATQLANFDENSYVLIGDADLWPINTDIFHRDSQKQILVTNSGCCGQFSHKNKEYNMYSMNHIGMSAKSWKEVMQLSDNDIEGAITQQ